MEKKSILKTFTERFLRKCTIKQLLAGAIGLTLSWSATVFGFFDSLSYIEYAKYISVIGIPAISYTLIFIFLKKHYQV